MIERFDAMAASGNKDEQTGKGMIKKGYILETLRRAYNLRAQTELRERGNDKVGKVTKGGDEERDCVEVFEMEGCEEEEEARGHEVEVGGREIVCGGAYNEDKTKTGEYVLRCPPKKPGFFEDCDVLTVSGDDD